MWRFLSSPNKIKVGAATVHELCRYSEASEAEGPVDAALGAFGHTIVHLVATVPWLRRTVRDMLPKPGDGPPEAFRENSNWKFTLYGWTQEEGKGERPIQCQVHRYANTCAGPGICRRKI